MRFNAARLLTIAAAGAAALAPIGAAGQISPGQLPPGQDIFGTPPGSFGPPPGAGPDPFFILDPFGNPTRTNTDFTRTTGNDFGANPGPIIVNPFDQRYGFPLPPGTNVDIIVINQFPGGSGGG